VTAALLALAGVLGGVLGTAGAITSLVTYPALLAAGLSPYDADVANLVAVLACWPGSALTSRTELRGTGPRLARRLPIAALGSAAGAGVLLATPQGVFGDVVPFLVLAGALAMLVQPKLSALRQRRAVRSTTLAAVGVGAVSLYSGYFGAGSGMMYLALLLVLTDDLLPQANAVKNMLVGAAALASAAVFVSTTSVVWSAVVPLAAGEFVGALAGPWVARRVPGAPLRWAIAALGVALAVELWLRA
jgi:uncharacterized membrane protein YfcA